jgi:cobalamin biosynthesis protein CobD/CbiB
MRAKEFIIENGGMKKIDPVIKAAMKNAITHPKLNQSTGSAYMGYRMGIALAGAPDYPTKMEADNWIGGDPLISTYTEEEYKMVMAAANVVGAGHGQNWSGKRSEEIPGINKTSPVAKIKRNKYGI